SRRYRPNMTLAQVARMYAGNWRPWVKIVSTELGVPPNTTLATYFHEDVVEPPALVFPAPKLDLVSPVPVVGSPFVFEAAEDRAGRPAPKLKTRYYAGMKILQLQDDLYAYLVHVVQTHAGGGIDPEEGLAVYKLWEAVTKNATTIDPEALAK